VRPGPVPWHLEIELGPCGFADRLCCESKPEQARALSKIGTVISNAIKERSTYCNLESKGQYGCCLAMRATNLPCPTARAETVLRLRNTFERTPANLITQGYAKAALKGRQGRTAEPPTAVRLMRNHYGLLAPITQIGITKKSPAGTAGAFYVSDC